MQPFGSMVPEQFGDSNEMIRKLLASLAPQGQQTPGVSGGIAQPATNIGSPATQPGIPMPSPEAKQQHYAGIPTGGADFASTPSVTGGDNGQFKMPDLGFLKTMMAAGAPASGAGPAGSTAVGGGAGALEGIMGSGVTAGASPAAAGGGAGGAGGMLGGAGGLAALAPFGYAAAIGLGKNTEANHANTPFGDVLLGGLAPSGAQILKDPVGMGLPALLGVPFLAPFFASKEAKATKPEWSGLFDLGF